MSSTLFSQQHQQLLARAGSADPRELLIGVIDDVLDIIHDDHELVGSFAMIPSQ